jgi:hypothetical protein
VPTANDVGRAGTSHVPTKIESSKENAMAINRTNHADYNAWPRWVSLVIGVWIFISAFVWPHTLGERTDTWILGVLIFLASIGAMAMPPVRFLNTLFAIWLFFSTLIIHHQQPGTLWSNCIAAIIVFIMSLIPSHASTTSGRGHPIPAV